MSLNHSPKVVTDGLVFYYDMSNPQKSWRGKPMTNYISNPTEEMARGEFGQYRDLAPTFNTYGLVPYSLSMDIKTNKNGSVLVYMQNGSYTKYSFVGSSVNATAEWQRFYFNNLTPAISTPSETAAILATYTGYGSGVTPTVRNIQLELGSYATAFVDGSRSNTQSILDLTGNNSITTNSLTYASNGTFSFNGSSNFMSLSSDVVFKTTGGHTVENWFKLDAVVSGNLYNFIGASSIDYHSWYWCVFQSRLAIWNVSPGGWYYGSTDIQSNVWYQAVMVTNNAGTGIQFYLNGVAEGGTHASYSFNSSYSGLKIGFLGRGDAPNARYMYGLMPVTKVYNRALSAAEVQQNFNAHRSRYGI